MKRLFILAGAALVALVACNKSETVVKENAQEITFKAITNSHTKGAELTGTHLFTNYSIYAAATQKNSSGIIENPNFFTTTEMQFKNGNESADPAVAVAADTPWHGNTLVYWPLGGVKMDYLAYAIPFANHADIAASAAAATVWKAYWNDASTDAAKTLSFNGVDTYANQVDVLYANANDRTSANSGSTKYVPMTFNHAQALLIFNVQVNAEANNKIQIKEIAFYTDERVKAMRDDQVAVAGGASSALATLADDDVTLKTVGTFTVDNSRNNLIAQWTYGAAWADSHKKEHWGMKPTAISAPSKSNNVVLAQTASSGDALYQNYNANIPFNGWDDDSDPGTPDVSKGYAQLGETLLIPEQEKVNFTMTYTLGGNTYFYTYNDLRGVWEKGKKYIYNIDIALQEIIITENVVDFVDALTHPGDGTGTGEIPLS